MAHGILERDFVKSGISTEKDWHGKTVSTGKPLEMMDFPQMTGEDIYNADGKPLLIDGQPWRVPVTADDGLPCGKPYNSDTFTLFSPRAAWEFVNATLAGTDYTVERIGLLWNRSKWFISTHLDELKAVSRKGESFQLNFSGGIDGTMSPQAELSCIRAVCWNTISLSRVSGKVLFKRKLTSGFTSALDAARNDIEQAVGMAAVFNASLESLENTPCQLQTAREIYTGAVSANAEKLTTTARNKVDGLAALFQRGLGNNGRTMADVLNGWTEHGTRGFSTSRKNIWTQIASSEFGGEADSKAEFSRMMFNPEQRETVRETGAKLLAMA